MQKNISTILIEAIVVGILLIIVFEFTKYLLPTSSSFIQLFVCGALFHILCEISGINIWYVKNYYSILNS